MYFAFFFTLPFQRVVGIPYRVLQRRPERKCEEQNDTARGEAGSLGCRSPSPLSSCRSVLHSSALAFFEAHYLTTALNTYSDLGSVEAQRLVHLQGKRAVGNCSVDNAEFQQTISKPPAQASKQSGPDRAVNQSRAARRALGCGRPAERGPLSNEGTDLGPRAEPTPSRRRQRRRRSGRGRGSGRAGQRTG